MPDNAFDLGAADQEIQRRRRARQQQQVQVEQPVEPAAPEQAQPAAPTDLGFRTQPVENTEMQAMQDSIVSGLVKNANRPERVAKEPAAPKEPAIPAEPPELKMARRYKSGISQVEKAKQDELKDFDAKHAALFTADETGKVDNTDIEALKQQAQDKVGVIHGAISPFSQAGDETDAAREAKSQLADMVAQARAINPNVQSADDLPMFREGLAQRRARIAQEHAAAAERKKQAETIYGQRMAAFYGPEPEAPVIPAPVAKKIAVAQAAQAQGAPVPAEVANDPEVSFWSEFGKNAADLGRSFGAGSGGLVKMVGDIYGLATGSMDNATSKFGKYVQEYWNEGKSADLVAREQARQQAIAAAPSEFGKAIEWVKATATDPLLTANALGEQVPQLVPSMGAGAIGGKVAAKLLLRKAATDALKIAAITRAASIGTKVGIAAGAAMQGADVGGDSYADTLSRLEQMSPEQAAAIPEIGAAVAAGEDIDVAKAAYALSLGRKVGVAAGVISLLANGAIPGGNLLERVAAGKGAGKAAGEAGGTLGRELVKAGASAAGEAGGEMVEEGGGLLASNIAARQGVDPNRPVTKGLGETVAQAGFVGALAGGPAALSEMNVAKKTPPAAPDTPAVNVPTDLPPPAAETVPDGEFTPEVDPELAAMQAEGEIATPSADTAPAPVPAATGNDTPQAEQPAPLPAETNLQEPPVEAAAAQPVTPPVQKPAEVRSTPPPAEITPAPSAIQPSNVEAPADMGGAAQAPTSQKPFALPRDLAGAKPSYAYGSKQFTLKFASDLDKALYIVAQDKPSKRDADYLRAVTESTGMTEAQARNLGKALRNQIKASAKDAPAGELSIPAFEAAKRFLARPAPSAAVPSAQTVTEPVAKPADSAPSQPPASESDKSQAQPTPTPEPAQGAGSLPTAQSIATRYIEAAPDMNVNVAAGNARKLAAILANDRGDNRLELPELLYPDNKVSRRIFTALTGVKLPTTLKGSREAFTKWANEGRKFAPASAPVSAKPTPAPASLSETPESESQTEKPRTDAGQAQTPPLIPRGQNTPAEFVKSIAADVGLASDSDAVKALSDFAVRLNKAAPDAFRGMEVYSLGEDAWKAHPETGTMTPDSSAAYNPETNTLFLREQKVKDPTALLSAIVHEAGHFAEKFALSESLIAREWAKLDDAQIEEAAANYNADDARSADAIRKDPRARKEWVAQQFARVVSGKAKSVPEAIRARFQAFWDAMKQFATKWLGAEFASSAALDAEVLRVMGFTEEAVPVTPKSIGKNASGNDIFETAEGRRYVIREMSTGETYRAMEAMRMYRFGEFAPAPRRNTDYETVEEAAARNPAPAAPAFTTHPNDVGGTTTTITPPRPKPAAKPDSAPVAALKDNVTGAIERGEKEAIVEKPVAKPSKFKVADDLRKGIDDLLGTPADQPATFTRKFGAKITAANNVIGMIVRDNPEINSRAKLAEFIAEVEPRLKPFSESLFSILSGAVDVVTDGASDWNAIYSAIDNPAKADQPNNQDERPALPPTPSLDEGQPTGPTPAGDETAAGNSGDDSRRGGPSGKPQGESGKAGSADTRSPSVDAGNTDAAPSTDGGATTSDNGPGVREDRPNPEPSGGRDVRADQDLRIQPDDVIVPKGRKSRINANIRAIELLRELGDKPATPAQKRILAQFSGWGDTFQVFGDVPVEMNRMAGSVFLSETRGRPIYLYGEAKTKYENWKREYGETFRALHPDLGGLMNDTDFQAAKGSSLNAHYTSRELISRIWSAVERLGFSGGKAIEPSAGIGHFIGLAPDSIASKTNWVGVELDNITGGLLKKLYPNQDVQITGFENSKRTQNNEADLVISNFPFGDYQVADASRPEYNKESIHNYFLARSVDAVRPGGLVVAISSRFTLDGTMNRKLRESIATKANLIAAIRLPNSAFKDNAGTVVVTDVMFFQKKGGSVEADGQRWSQSLPIEIDGNTVNINEYFAANPGNIIGQPSMQGTMYGGKNKDGEAKKEYTVDAPKGRDVVEVFDEIANKLPSNITGTDAKPVDKKTIIEGAKPNSYAVRDGKVYQVDDQGQATEQFAGKAADIAKAKQLIAIRDSLVAQIKLESNPDSTDAAIADQRKKLNAAYDAYVNKHGALNKSDLIEDDPEWPLVASLEDEFQTTETTAKGKERRVTSYKKATPLLRRFSYPSVEPTSAQTIDDAISISVAHRAKVDSAFISSLLSRPVEEVEREIVESEKAYRNPDTGTLEIPEIYLSGFVRLKLEVAQRAVKDNPEFARNVAALEKAQPPKAAIEKTQFRLGSSWIPAKTIARFLDEVIGVKAKVIFSRTSDSVTWDMNITAGDQSAENTSRWGVRNDDGDIITGADLILDSLNLKLSKMTREIEDEGGNKKKVDDAKGTAAARDMQNRIQAEFRRWVLSDTTTAAEMTDAYDRTYGGITVRKTSEPDLEHFPGASPLITLRPWQKRAARRASQEATLLSHSVGTGKTFTLITAAMELRRLGSAKKPMVVVQNSTIGQFARSFRTLYPNANILVAPSKSGEGVRERFTSLATTREWDAVIVPISFFERIPNDPIRERAYVNEQLDLIEAAIIAAEGANGNTAKPKTSLGKLLQKARKRAEARLVRILERAKENSDNVVSFENMGVDALLVDEAHAFKRGDFFTKMDNIKGLDTNGSDRSLGFYLKTQFIHTRTPDRNVILATGTPISNTLAEMWTMARYVKPNFLKQFGVETFDDFVGSFAIAEAAIEETPTGGFKQVLRLAKYVNGPAITNMWRTVADIYKMNRADLKDVPKIKGGGPQEIIIERSPEVTKFVNFLTDWRKWWDDLKGEDKAEMSWVPLVQFGLARKSSIDLRLVNPDLADDPKSKLNAAVDKIYDSWKAGKDVTGVTLVFSNIYQSHDPKAKWLNEEMQIPNPHYGKAPFNAFTEMTAKLVARGVPAEQIGNFTEMTKPQIDRAADRLNEGTMRIAFGSTETLGTGLNIQRHITDTFHMDPQFRPMDWEQRNGRSVRQGNENPEVFIGALGVKGTMDTTLYQLMLRKGKFIAQAETDDLAEFEDPSDENVMSFQQMTAAFSGNPLQAQRFSLENEQRQLEAIDSTERRRSAEAATSLRDLRQNSPRFSGIISDIRAAGKIVNKAFPGEKTVIETVEIEGKTYTGKEAIAILQTETATAIDQMEADLIQDAKDNKILLNSKELSEVKSRWGFRVSRARTLTAKVNGIEISINQSVSVIMKEVMGDAIKDADGKIQSFKRVIEVEPRTKDSMFNTTSADVVDLFYSSERPWRSSTTKISGSANSPVGIANGFARAKETYAKLDATEKEGIKVMARMEAALDEEANKSSEVSNRLKEVNERLKELQAKMESETPTEQKQIDIGTITREFPEYAYITKQITFDGADKVLAQIAADERAKNAKLYFIYRNENGGGFIKATRASDIKIPGFTDIEFFITRPGDKEKDGVFTIYLSESGTRVASGSTPADALKIARDALLASTTFQKQRLLIANSRVSPRFAARTVADSIPLGETVRWPIGDGKYASGIIRSVNTGSGFATVQDDTGVEIKVAAHLIEVRSPQSSTLGTPAERTTETPEFKRWFGKSKVVDENGKPQRVFHGTHVYRDEKRAIDFGNPTIFDRNFALKFFGRKPGMDNVGSWFTTEANSASKYGPAVMPVYLSIQKPFIITGDGANAPQWASTRLRSLVESEGGVEEFRNRLKGEGYDGILLQDDMLDGLPGDVWIAMEPTQIKSAIGNSGAFDPANPSILGSPAEREELNPPKGSAVGDSKTEFYRRHTDTLLERGYDAERTTYERKTNASTKERADAFIAAAGETAAAAEVFNNASPLSGPVRVAVGIEIERRLDARALDASLTPEQRTEARANFNRFSERLAALGTESGQTSQAFDMVSNPFTRNGAIHAATQGAKTRTDRMLGEDGRATEDEIVDAMNTENGKVIEDLLKDVKADVRKVKVTKAMVERSAGELPKNKKELDAAIKQAFADVGKTINDIIRTHITSVDAIGTSLVEKLRQEAGLSDAEARRLEEAVRLRLAQKTEAAKRKVLDRLSKSKGGVSRKIFTLIDKIVEMSNAGAIDQPALRARIAEELKLPRVTDELAAKLKELTDKRLTVPEGFQRDRIDTDILTELRKVKGVGPVDIATAIYYSHILSGYTTQMVNIISTALNTAADTTILAATAEADILLRRNGAKLGTPTAQAIKGLFTGAKMGFSQAIATLNTGYAAKAFDEKMPDVQPVLEILSKEPAVSAAGKGLKGYALLLRYITRSMKAADAVFYRSASEAFQRVAAAKIAGSLDGGMSRAEANEKIRTLLSMSPADFENARKQARAEGLSGYDANLRVGELIEQSRNPNAVHEGHQFALESTFNGHPRGALGVIAKGISDMANGKNGKPGVTALKLFVPFTNIVANVTNASLNYSPMGAVRAKFGYLGESKMTASERENAGIPSLANERPMLIAKSFAGTAAMLALLAYAMSSDDDEAPLITANGPKDQDRKNQLRQSGWKPHSIKIGDAYVSYLSSPMAIPLAFVGNWVDGVRYNDLGKGDTLTNATKAFVGIGSTVTEMSFLSGVADLFDTLRGKPGASPEKWAANVATSAAVPNLVRQLDRTFDPTLRQGEGLTGQIAASLPVVRQSLPERMTPTARPIRSMPTDRFGGVATNDPLWDVLNAKGAVISNMTSAKIGDRQATPEELRAIVKDSGPNIERRLRAELPAIRRMTNEQADAHVAKVAREERAASRDRLPTLMRRRVPTMPPP